MLAMSTLMMPAATMTTMTNAGPIPVAAATKLEPKLLQLPHPALMQQMPQQPQPQPHHHQHQHNNNKLGSKYMSSGVLVDEKWVLTTADGLFLMGESIRLLRVRLGSTNYKHGGVLLPVKMLEIHPYFDDRRPNFDLALIMLANPVKYTPSLRAIKLQMTPRKVTASHFTVTSWPGPRDARSKNSTLQSMEMIKRHRILSVTHLHPSDPEECAEELKEIGTTKDGIMCLDPAMKDPCMRDIGAPVVLNNILWAMVSSWKPDDCDESSGGPIFATLVAAKNISSWIHATVHGHRWKQA